jgi:N-glycosylase/DNA lyase
MELNKPAISQLKKIYRIKKKEIVSRIKEFEKLWLDGSDEEVFTELAFCLTTPQSKAKSCWNAIVKLKEQDLLLKGNTGQIKQRLNYVRFRNKKAEYVVKARKLFMNNNRVSIKPLLNSFVDIYECREWLVNNVVGFGYKEASHFLRNIGLGDKIAILDRHILRSLKEIGVIEEIPESLGRTRYMKIEKQMIGFARQIRIPVSRLDLLLWYKGAGEIFK